MRSYLCISVIALLLFVFSGCSGNSAGAVHLTGEQLKSVIDQLNEIDQYNGYESDFTEVKTINSVKLYGAVKKQDQKDRIALYLWDMSGSYVKYKDAAYEVAGGCYPVIVNARMDGKALHVIDLELPEDGVDYTASIKKMFPGKYAEKILEEGIETCEKLEREQNQKIKDYWGVEISDDHFALDAQTGGVVIVRSVEGYDQKGEYFFDKEVVARGNLDKKEGDHQQ